MSDETLLTTEQVAARFQLTAQTVRRRCQRGAMVPPPVLARPYRFSPAQVQQVIDGTWTSPAVVGRAPGQARRFFTRGTRAKLALLNS